MRRAAAAIAAVCALAAFPAEAADDPAAALPGSAALAPLQRSGAIERHTAEDLWERIDGEAELYRGYGLASSAHALYEDPAGGDRRVEVSAFLLAEPLGAFGVFAAFRPQECSGCAGLGNGCCIGDFQGQLWQGRHFVLADAAGPEATRAADIRRALGAAAALLGPPPPAPQPLQEFSRLVDAGSIRYQPQHLLGRSALPPGLEGVAAGIPVFASVGPATVAGARAALDAYAATLEGTARSERDGRLLLVGRDPALGPVVLVGSNRGIAGARATPEAAGLWELLAALAAAVGGVGTAGAR